MSGHSANTKPRQPHWVDSLSSGCPLVFAPRTIDETTLTEAATLLTQTPQSVRLSVTPDRLLDALNKLFVQIGAGIPLAQRLAQSLATELAEALYSLSAPHAQLRLEIVDQQTCPKLHVDRLRARICVTLAGPGTEYLPDGRAPDPNDPEPPMQMPVGRLAAMAGSLMGRGLWHRSPHACTEHKRLFLSLDVS